VNWRWTGYSALIYLAAMRAIPSVPYDAARLDGAGPWRQFTNVDFSTQARTWKDSAYRYRDVIARNGLAGPSSG
jgi:hypothetical protein